MLRFITALFATLLLAATAKAADNAVIATPGVGVTIRSIDVGSGVQSIVHILGNTSGTTIYGTAGTANAAVLSVQGIASGTSLAVTASAGTNLNTSALMLDATGQSILTAVGSAIPAGTANIGNVYGPTNVTVTECGGTRAGSASDAFAASATKHGFTLMNISDVGMWVRFAGTAAPAGINSFLLNPGTIASSIAGGSVFMPVGVNTALSVYGTGDFSCIYW